MPRLSIKLKLTLAVACCLGAVAFVSAALARANYLQDVQFTTERAVRSAESTFASMERREVDKLSSTLDALVGDRALAAPFAEREREPLLEVAAPIFRDLKERHGVTHWAFIDPARVCFLRVQRPEMHGDLVDRVTLRTAVRTSGTASGKELGRTGFALRVARPFTLDGKLLGYMELGEETRGLLARMKAQTGDEYGLVAMKKSLDERAFTAARGDGRSGWGDDPEMVTVDVTDAGAPIVGTSAELRDLAEGSGRVSQVVHGSRRFVRGATPVVDAAGRKVGAVFVLHDVTALHDRMLADQKRVVVVMALVALAMLALLLGMFEWLVFRRLVRMTEAMREASTRLAGGDYDIGGTVRPVGSASDEIGRFEAFLGTFLTAIGTTLRELEKRRRPSA